MDWNDTVTLLILADTALNAKLLVGGYFLWRWWSRRKSQVTAHWQGVVMQETGAVNWVGYGEKEAE